MLGKTEDRRRRRRQRMRWLDSITSSVDMTLSKLQDTAEGRGAWRAAVHGVAKIRTQLTSWTTMTTLQVTVGSQALRKQQGTELASTHVLCHQVIWGGRPEVTRKRKPREAFAAPQPLCNGHGWGHSASAWSWRLILPTAASSTRGAGRCILGAKRTKAARDGFLIYAVVWTGKSRAEEFWGKKWVIF